MIHTGSLALLRQRNECEVTCPCPGMFGHLPASLPQLFGLCLFNTNNEKVYMRAHYFDWEKWWTAAVFDVRPGSVPNQTPCREGPN